MKIQFITIFSLGLITSIFGMKERIIGGVDVINDEFPFIASLKFIDPEFHFCGGSIITSLHILTAAHCFFNKLEYIDNMVAYTGSVIPNPNPYCGEVHKLSKITNHPAFDGKTLMQHDISVVTLKKAIQFNSSQKKIALPKSNIRDEMFGTMAGWGSLNYDRSIPSPILQKITMKIISREKCNNYFKNPIHKQQFCAQSTFGKSLSFGDSGGPLFIDDKLVGISVSNFPRSKNIPEIFTNVFDYMGFINYAIQTDVAKTNDIK